MVGKWMTDKQIKKLEDEAWKKCAILTTAYVMDELGYDEDKIMDFHDHLDKWIDAIDEHLITIDQVCKIIEEHTGIKIK